MSSTGLAINSSELPALAKVPPMTASLAYHVAGDVLVDGHCSPAVGEPSGADVAEAKRRLQEAEHLCRQPTPRLIAAWCSKLRTLPKAPPNDEAIASALVAIVTACGDLPAAVFTAETAKLALQRFKWWPGPAEIYELLSQQAAPFRRTLDGLKRVIAKRAAPEEKQEPAAPEYVTALVKAFVAERSWNQEGGRPAASKTPPKPLTHSDARLIMEYEKLSERTDEFGELARMRLKMLLAKSNRSYADKDDV